MKKAALSVVSVLMIIAMIFCLAACGGNEDQAKLEKYIKDNNIEAMMSASATEDMEINTYAKDSSIVIDVKVKKEISEAEEDALKAQMDSSFSATESSFNMILEDIKKNADVANPSIVYNVKRQDDSVITSKTFS